MIYSFVRENGFEPKIIQLFSIKASQSITEFYNYQPKVFQDLGQFVEFIQSIIHIDNLLQAIFFLCSEESNLKVGWVVHTVLPD